MVVQTKLGGQKATLLQHMIDNPNKWFLASAFCGGSPECRFIGYESPTRLGDLQRDDLVVSRWSKTKTKNGRNVKEYKLNHEYYHVKEDGCFVSKIRPML